MISPANKRPLKGGWGGGAGSPLVPPAPALPAVAQVDPRTSGQDLRLIGAAVRKGWVIREEVMTRLPDAMSMLALDSRRDDRTRINAARVLVAMHGQNEPVPAAAVQVNVNGTAETVAAMLQEPGYVRWAQGEAVPDSGTVRPGSN